MFSEEFEEKIAKELIANVIEIAAAIAESKKKPRLLKQKEFMETLGIGKNYLAKLKQAGLREHRLEAEDTNIFYDLDQFEELMRKM